MQRNITLAIDDDLIRKVKVLAARRNLSVSALLREELSRLVSEEAYETAKRAALERLERGSHLGGGPRPSRDEIHDRAGLLIPTTGARVPTYKGNRGNLLQHWLLAELIGLLHKEVQPTGELCYFDAHAMSPFAVRAANPGQGEQEFNAVAANLPGQRSAYEQAWHELSRGQVQYPSSAMFVQHLWRRPLQLVMCEIDEATANDIDEWKRTLPTESVAELYRGDWRNRLSQGLPAGSEAYLISFDPYMFDRHGPSTVPNPGNMWPSDINHIRAAVLALEREGVPIIVQLSTYSANNANRQQDVVSTIKPLLKVVNLELAATVRADGNMMSMVFTRSIPRVADAGLEQEFRTWFE